MKKIHSVADVVVGGVDGVDSWVCSVTPVLAVGCVTVGELIDSVVGLAMEVGGDVPAEVEVDSLGCSEIAVDGAVEGVVGGGELGLSVEGLGISVDGLGLSVVSVAGLLSVDGGALVDDSVDAASVVSVVSIGTVVSSVVGAVSVVV